MVSSSASMQSWIGCNGTPHGKGWLAVFACVQNLMMPWEGGSTFNRLNDGSRQQCERKHLPGCSLLLSRQLHATVNQVYSLLYSSAAGDVNVKSPASVQINQSICFLHPSCTAQDGPVMHTAGGRQRHAAPDGRPCRRSEFGEWRP